SSEQTHQPWQVHDMLEEMIGIHCLDRSRWQLLQDLIHISHNVDALMVQCINANRFRMSFATSTTKLQCCALELGQAGPFFYDRHRSFLVHRQMNNAVYPCNVSSSLEIDIEPRAAQRRAAISTVSVRIASVKA